MADNFVIAFSVDFTSSFLDPLESKLRDSKPKKNVFASGNLAGSWFSNQLIASAESVMSIARLYTNIILDKQLAIFYKNSNGALYSGASCASLKPREAIANTDITTSRRLRQLTCEGSETRKSTKQGPRRYRPFIRLVACQFMVVNLWCGVFD